MKKSTLANKLQKSVYNKNMLKPDIIVKTGISEIDILTGGLKAGRITFIEGDSKIIRNIPNQICVNSYRTFQSDTIYIDGGMCADPYNIAQYARLMEMDQKETLRHVRISRAFTVHQMTTVIHEMLEPAIKTYRPQTLVIGRLPTLYHDSDIETQEAQILLKTNLEKIRKLAESYNLITIFTYCSSSFFSNTRNIREIIYDYSDEVISLKQKEKIIHVQLPKTHKESEILLFSKGQLSLQHFGMVT